ncbi:MAG: hypothetical protein JW749_08075 [Sedimentisphaerales bacterium]|nr:hypothetical protein [Sedimentisphaerales bacterium]
MSENHKEHNHDHGDVTPDVQETEAGRQLSPGYVYLSNALRVSFIFLQLIMIVLVAVFLVSGFKRVNHDEQALVLVFGKITGAGENRLRGPGLTWVWPYPVGEIIRVPTQRKINIPLNLFWYYQKPGDEMGMPEDEPTYFGPTLNPLTEGYLLVRGEKQTSLASAGSEGHDYNILHSKWVLTYQITDPESFFKNCYVDTGKLQPGQNYADVIETSIRPMLVNFLADSVVTTMVNFTIEEAMYERASSVTDHVKRLLQTRLDKIDSGIRIVDVQRNRIAVARQVEAAFQAALSAVQEREKMISEAKLYAEKTLNEAAGPVAVELLDSLRDKNADQKHKEWLWLQLAGKAQEKITDARAYRTKTVEAARANADYLAQILPEYRKRPELVLQRIYNDAIEQILDNVQEKIIVQPGKASHGKEVRILINRDPAMKSGAEPEE